MEDNQGDQPLSSEELLRRAREGLGDSGPATLPPSDFQIESYSSPTPEPDPDVMEPVASPEPTAYEPPVAETPTYYEPTPPPASDPSSWAPPPTDSSDDSWAGSPPAPMPTAEPTRRRSAGNTIWVLVVLVIVGMGVFSLFDSSKTVEEIEVGDCFDMPEDDVFNTVETVDCNEAHDLEVYAMVDMGLVSGNFSVIAPYPGDLELYEAALDECLDAFNGYVGVEYPDSVLYVDAFTPTIEGWEEFDDRGIQCVLLQLDPTLTDIVPSNRSFRNSGF